MQLSFLSITANDCELSLVSNWLFAWFFMICFRWWCNASIVSGGGSFMVF